MYAEALELWVESAHGCLLRDGATACNDVVRTLQTRDRFSLVLVSGSDDAPDAVRAEWLAERAAALLEGGALPGEMVDALLVGLSSGEHVPFSILQVRDGRQAFLVECDAPPLFMTHAGRLMLLPVVEEEVRGRLVRRCEFELQERDHLAVVSEGYVCGAGEVTCWRWRDVATAVRRLTETGCDAEQLLGALLRSYRRMTGETISRDVSVVAMAVRPERSMTVWTGPPGDLAQDAQALALLMAETGTRAICGDTTAEIAARGLGRELEPEPRPEEGWAEVPPTWRLEGVDLVTEGVVTLNAARERLARAARPRDLAASDGATRLARLLLAADLIHFVIGTGVNPEQAAGLARSIPLRREAVDALMHDLTSRGKMVSALYL